MNRYLQIILIALTAIYIPFSFSDEDPLMEVNMSIAEFQGFQKGASDGIGTPRVSYVF